MRSLYTFISTPPTDSVTTSNGPPGPVSSKRTSVLVGIGRHGRQVPGPVAHRYPGVVGDSRVIERARTAMADLLVAAARAIHAERDPDRLTAWVADALQAATGASTAGPWLHMDPGAPLSVTATRATPNPGDLGHPRTPAPLAPRPTG